MEESFDLGKLMRKHQKQHKIKPAEFVSAASAVNKRRNSNLKYRKSLRNTLLDNIRQLSCESPLPVKTTLSKCEHRKQQLEKWKEQKEKEKKEAATKKKKPFIVGVPNVPQKYVPPPPIKPLPSTSGRVTRSQSSKLAKPVENKEIKLVTLKSFAPKNATFKAPQIKNAPKLLKLAETKIKDKKNDIRNLTFNPIVHKEERKTRQTRSKAIITRDESNPVSKRTQKTKATVMNHKDDIHKTPIKPVPKSESSSEEKLRSPKQDDIVKTPEQIVEEAVKNSPYVIMSRGKANATKELKKKFNEALFDEDEELDNVEYFRQQLSSEIKRLTDMCDTWTAISEHTVLPDSAQEAVLSAVGQARLLMSQKFGQFSSLVDTCADPQPHQPLVTVADLQGFWDMMFMQVENVNMRFKKLEELQSRGWEEQKPLEVRKKVVKGNAKKVAKPAAGPSRLREMIAAARKAKKDLESPVKPTDGDNKTFEAGFFSVCSPIRSPTARSPSYHSSANNSMLKAVLSSEAKKSARKSCASFAILRASVMGKNMEVEGIAPIPQTPLTPINIYATPGRSILKAPNTNQKSTGKSVKMVLFNKSDDEDAEDSHQILENCNQTVENCNKTEENYNKTAKNCHETAESCHLTPENCNKIAENCNKTSANKVEETTEEMELTSHDENKENKVSSRRKSKLLRQDAEYRSPILTRSRRKSNIADKSPSDIKHEEITLNFSDLTPAKHGVTPRRSSRRLLQEAGEVIEEKPRKRRSSSMKSSPQSS